MTHFWYWRKYLPDRHGQRCKVLATGSPPRKWANRVGSRLRRSLIPPNTLNVYLMIKYTHSEYAERIMHKAIKTIGKNTKRIRKMRGMTQKQMADHMGVRQPYITRLERGQCIELPVGRMLDAADALGVRPQDLLEENQ